MVESLNIQAFKDKKHGRRIKRKRHSSIWFGPYEARRKEEKSLQNKNKIKFIHPALRTPE